MLDLLHAVGGRGGRTKGLGGGERNKEGEGDEKDATEADLL